MKRYPQPNNYTYITAMQTNEKVSQNNQYQWIKGNSIVQSKHLYLTDFRRTNRWNDSTKEIQIPGAIGCSLQKFSMYAFPEMTERKARMEIGEKSPWDTPMNNFSKGKVPLNMKEC